MNKLTFIQDSEPISEEIIQYFKLDRKDIRYSIEQDIEVCNFVGIVYRGENILISLPKHYADISSNTEDLEKRLSQIDVELLFRVIVKYKMVNTDERIGRFNEDIISNYPITAFYRIYEYYQRYGVYKENRVLSHPGGRGTISWKDTIRKSNQIISDNQNLILLPLYKREKKNTSVFLTECMVFVIRYTLKKFQYALQLPFYENCNCNDDMIKRSKWIVQQLIKIKRKTFKDMDKQLIYSLIDFFENVPPSEGDLKVKTYSFESIWESIVEVHLNQNFQGFNNNKLEFNSIYESKFKFGKQVSYNINRANKFQSIRLDYFYKSGNVQFIFDAKYYREINSLDYKQLVYHLLLKNEADETVSVLVVPTSSRSHQNQKLHFDLDTDKIKGFNGEVKIYEYELNVKQGMKLYINK